MASSSRRSLQRLTATDGVAKRFVVAAIAVLLAACSSEGSSTEPQPTPSDAPAPVIETETQTSQNSDPPPVSGAETSEKAATDEKFSFTYNLHDSLPEDWVTEFLAIMQDMGDIAPISPRITEVPQISSPMNVWAWMNSADNPFPEKPGVSGTCICGDGSDTWMALEMYSEGFKPENLHIHRYQVIVHEYFHVFQIALSGDRAEPIWLWEGGAQTMENLYSQQRYDESAFESSLFPITATWVNDPSPLEGYEYTDADNNYQFSTFMTLALVKELQLQRQMSEVHALRLVLVDFQNAKFSDDNWKEVFAETFGMRPEEFYGTLNKYTITESPEEWYEGDVVDASPVMPSQDLRIEDIFVANP